MGQYLVYCESSLSVLFEHTAQQVFGRPTEESEACVTLQIERLIAGAIFEFLIVTALERRGEGEEHVHERPHTPNVTGKAVVHAADHFWSDVAGSTNSKVGSVLR